MAAGYATAPAHASYDVVIVGGAIMGSATAWFLTEEADFDGRVLVVERAPGYEDSATARTNSCIRQQFSHPLNIRLSQFTARFIRDLPARMGDARAPSIAIENFGYLYLVASEAAAELLRANAEVQRAAGAETELLSPAEIAARYPFYALDDVVLGSINTRDEGYWDGGTLFEWFRRSARARGVEYVAGEVVGLERAGGRVTRVRLASGDSVACGQVVNAAGACAAQVAALAGIDDLPVEPRKRFSWVFRAARPLPATLPLTIDPSGVHVRQDGPGAYLAGAAPEHDLATDADDFALDPARWEEHVWPILAARIPAFEAIRVVSEWAGHYDFNTLDQNAILGPHPDVPNFFFQNGFSGHGLQQSPGMGRGMAELLTQGEYRSLDLAPFGYARVAAGRPMRERAVI